MHCFFIPVFSKMLLDCCIFTLGHLGFQIAAIGGAIESILNSSLPRIILIALIIAGFEGILKTSG